MRLTKLLILSTCLTGLSVAAQAQTCTTRPSCESLGYDMTESDCSGKLFLRCPFDASAVWCGGSLCPTVVTCVAPATCAETCESDSSVCVRCETPDRGEFFDGRGNTQKIIAQIGANALAATACNQFYPAPEGISSTDATFGAGKWYLPAMGELIKMYGLNINEITDGCYGTGADSGKGLTLVNTGLAAAGGTTLTTNYYWSSSEASGSNAWDFAVNNGYRNSNPKQQSSSFIRCFNLLENLTSSTDSPPQIGDIMFSDKTWGSSTVSGKTPVGVVVDVYGSDVTIFNLKDLRFSNTSSANNFNATNPYTGQYIYTYWEAYVSPYTTTDITALTNYNGCDRLLTEIQNYQYW